MTTTEETKKMLDLQNALLHYSIRHAEFGDYLTKKKNHLMEMHIHFKEKGDEAQSAEYLNKWYVMAEVTGKFNL